MKATETASSSADSQTVKHQSHADKFTKVMDGRKHPIRGLWERNGRYYAQLRVENPISGKKKTKRIPLKDKEGNPVQTQAQAMVEMRRLQTQREDNALPVLDRTPKFGEYAARYIEAVSSGQGEKKPGTIEKEETILARWSESIGELRLDQIKRVHVNRFIEKRLKENVAHRTINLDIIGLRVVLKRALSDGIIQRLPTEGLRPLKVSTPKRSLFSTVELDALCNAAFETKTTEDGKSVPLTKNAQQFADYIRLMAYSGARRNEALGLKWEDADFDNEQLHFRRQVTNRGIEDLKNRDMRVIDLNPKLKAHLLDMKERGQGVSVWLFPSPQRGDKDIPAKSFRKSLDMVRTKAGMPGFNFHDCRHHFISMCVMSGIDFMTIAAWVGHKDGGILVGKIYGHLANEHRKAQAQKVNLGPVVVDSSSQA